MARDGSREAQTGFPSGHHSRYMQLIQNVTSVAHALCLASVAHCECDPGRCCSACSNSLLPEGGVVLGWQEGLHRFRPGAANVRVIGHLTGNAQQPRGVWETGARREREYVLMNLLNVIFEMFLCLVLGS